MKKFLLKGLLRDRSRSLLPFTVVTAGVFLTVFLHTWMSGFLNDFLRQTAGFQTGHVKITTREYARYQDQFPNDLALTGLDSLLNILHERFPGIIWQPRIRFAGLLDAPDQNGETRVQAPIMGLGVALHSPESREAELLHLKKALASGRLPRRPGEMLLSDDLSHKMGLPPGSTATLISSSMEGGLALYNFTVCGTVRFGVTALDRGAMIADLSDVQQALDMPDAAGELLGFFPDFIYRTRDARRMADEFNRQFSDPNDDFSPVMVTLLDQNQLSEMFDYMKSLTGIFIGIFLFIMSLVLWNAGLMGSLRRYGEFGVRLAIGEDKLHLFLSTLYESLAIGMAGSILGTALGVGAGFYLQYHGINISSMMQNSSILISNVMYARVTPFSFVIGFIPGLLATLLGTTFAGYGIYKRQTAQLFREMEA